VQRSTYVEPLELRCSIVSHTTLLAHTIQGHFRRMVLMCQCRGVRGCSCSPGVSLLDLWGRCPALNSSPISLGVHAALGHPLADWSRDSNRPSRKEKGSKSK
jgi:hypothetical protein